MLCHTRTQNLGACTVEQWVKPLPGVPVQAPGILLPILLLINTTKRKAEDGPNTWATCYLYRKPEEVPGSSV